MRIFKTIVFLIFFALCFVPVLSRAQTDMAPPSQDNLQTATTQDAPVQSADAPAGGNTNAENENGEAPIGTIMEIEGPTTITRAAQVGPDDNGKNSAAQPAAVEMPIYMNDVIETGENGRADILMIDDTEITLGENAHFTVDEYVYNPDDVNENSGRFAVARGAFLWVSGLLTKIDKPDVKIKTAYGSIGIRGTTLWGGDIDGEYGILVNEGEVSVDTGRGIVNVPAGKGTTINKQNKTPEKAKPWGEEKVAAAQKRIALKNRDAVKKRIENFKGKQSQMREQFKENLKKRRAMHLKDENENGDGKGKWQKKMRSHLNHVPHQQKNEEMRDDMHDQMQQRMENRMENKRPTRPQQQQQRHSPL